MSGTPCFAGAAQRMPHNHLALEATGAYVHGSHETITVRETVLGRPLPQGTAQITY